jgi:PAS domain S-box-containing protein
LIGIPVELVRAASVFASTWLLSEAIVVDTTRARLEQARLRAATAELLLDKEERLRLAVEAANVGIFSRRLDTDEIQWDPQTRWLMGLDPAEPVTLERLFAAIHPDDRARAQEAMQAAIATRSKYVNEFRVTWPDGSVHWVRGLGRTQDDAAGRPAVLLGVALDITEAKRAEQILAEEARHREEILEAERAARTEAERVARMKDEFLATLSHELRTPLTAILGWAERLTKRERSEDVAARGLACIERNALSLAQMVSDLLDVSRIISGKAQLDLQPTDLRELVMEAIAAVEPSAQSREIQLEVKLDAAYAVVMGDAIRLRQIIWNLLSNAIKFTPQRGRVHVVLRSTAESAEIEVSDTGQGIEPEFLPHVFDRFRQADASSTRAHRGLGLGLGLVKNFVELHGGTVRAESAGVGRGATFAVTLALATGPAADPARGAPMELAGVKVLVVEDDADASDLVRRILEECRADVITVGSASEALLAIKRFRPDVLLSDIGMPGQDGYQLIHALRALAPAEGGRTPAAALTAFATAEHRIRALSAGYQAHLAKPIEVEKLLRVVSSLAAQKTPAA